MNLYNIKVLYTNGDSVVWGAELENKVDERFSKVLSDKLGMVDCNNASSGVSNDYIYRQTLRDVSHWLETKQIWSEETGWINADELLVVIGWTAPTRFEWWDGEKYIQERLWAGYDKWGNPDEHRTTEDTFVLHQTELIPSYIRTLNHVIGLDAYLTLNKIPHYFFNVFYEYEIVNDPINKIDDFGRNEHQLSIESMFKFTPNSFRNKTMYYYIKDNGGNFLPRKHPDKMSHKMWANFLYENII